MSDKFLTVDELLERSWDDPERRRHLRNAVFQNNRMLREANEELMSFIDSFAALPDGTNLWKRLKEAERVIGRFVRMDAEISRLQDFKREILSLKNVLEKYREYAAEGDTVTLTDEFLNHLNEAFSNLEKREKETP